MKYIKTFENIDLENQIKTIVSEVTFSDMLDPYDLDGCPFTTELAILHQKDYIKDIFFVSSREPKNSNLTLREFTNTYNKLANQATRTIIEYLEEDPTAYKWCENYNIVPDWIKQANKYNV